MARLIWTEPVLRELEEIADYIAVENPAAARRTVSTLFERAEQLASFPLSGRTPPELPDSRYRELVVGVFRLFYRVEEDAVYIVHLMRAERDFPYGYPLP